MNGKIKLFKSSDGFSVIKNQPLRNVELSWKAKGLLAYLLHLPEDWEIYVSDLKNRSKDGRDSTAGALRELVRAGYVIRKQKHDEKGKFAGYDYEVHELPVNGKAVDGKPVNGKTVNGKPVTNKETSNQLLNDSKKTIDQKIVSEETPPKEIQGKKTKAKKWEGAAFVNAKIIFDQCYREFTRNRGLTVGEEEGVYWSPKENNQLSNLMKMVKHKAANSKSKMVFKTDEEFVELAMKMFLETAAKLTQCWYMDKFSPTNFVTNFESLYLDIKRNLANGYIGDKKDKGQSKIKGDLNTLAAIRELQNEGFYS